MKKRYRKPIYYIAVEMPKTGLGSNQLRYYKASRDLNRMLRLEEKLNASNWKQSFMGSLLVVPKKYYRHPDQLSDQVAMAFLAKVVGITSFKPKFTIASTRSQFVLSNDWTQYQVSPNYLTFVQHDYNTATKAKIAKDWHDWRDNESRCFAKHCHEIILNQTTQPINELNIAVDS